MGSTATKLGAWKRVCQNLRKERGRVDVLRVMKDKDQLHGKGNAGGIEECRQVVTEMERMQAGKVPGRLPPPPPPAETDVGFAPPADANGASSAAAPGSQEAAVEPWTKSCSWRTSRRQRIQVGPRRRRW